MAGGAGQGYDWGGFFDTDPLNGLPPLSPSTFGKLLISEPDAPSARNVLGAGTGTLDGTIGDQQVAFGNGNAITGDPLFTFSDNGAFQTLTINEVDLQYDVNASELVIDNPTRFVFWLFVNHYLQLLSPNTVASLPDPPGLGMITVVSDGQPNLNWGDTIVGGASTKYLVWHNGTNWIVIGGSAPGLIILPTTDPHVLNALWLDNGIIAVSQG